MILFYFSVINGFLYHDLPESLKDWAWCLIHDSKTLPVVGMDVQNHAVEYALKEEESVSPPLVSKQV